jgi:hypothetical protein
MRVRIEPAGDAEAGLWRTALEIASLFADLPWVIIGAQMLMLLEHEHGRPSGRTTQDLDAIVDVRALAGGIGVAARRLAAAGFEPRSDTRTGSSGPPTRWTCSLPTTSGPGRT